MRVSQIVSGLVVLLLAAMVALQTRTFPREHQGIGPAFFPTLIAAALAVCGLALLVRGWKTRSVAQRVKDTQPLRPRLIFNAWLVIAALIFYALLVETLGFFITAFVFLVTLFVAFGVKRRWIGPIAIGITLGLHVAFYSLLRVPLPWGWLEPIAW